MARSLKLFAVPMIIAATAYVKAQTRKAAVELARKEYLNQELTFRNGEGEGEISDRPFDTNLPEVAVAPAMTVTDVSARNVEIAYEYKSPIEALLDEAINYKENLTDPNADVVTWLSDWQSRMKKAVGAEEAEAEEEPVQAA